MELFISDNGKLIYQVKEIKMVSASNTSRKNITIWDNSKMEWGMEKAQLRSLMLMNRTQIVLCVMMANGLKENPPDSESKSTKRITNIWEIFGMAKKQEMQ